MELKTDLNLILRHLQITADNEDGDFFVGWNYYRTKYAILYVGPVTAFLAMKLKSGFEKNRL